MRKTHVKPKNEADFERLCLKLLRAHWKCPDLELYGKRGQKQFGVDIVDLSGKDPLRAAQCKLHEEGKVTDRGEVKKEIEKAINFKPTIDIYAFMTTGKVMREVDDLVLEINQHHAKKGLLIVKVLDWERIEDLLDEHLEVRDWYEGVSPSEAVKRLESKASEIFGKFNLTRGQNESGFRRDEFHAEIDEAKTYIENNETQMAKLLLRRIRERHWDKLDMRHRFRILSNLAAVELAEDRPQSAAELYLKAKEQQPDDEIAQTNEALAYLLLGNRKRAFELAGGLKGKYPRSPRLVSIYIRCAPATKGLSFLLESVPEGLAWIIHKPSSLVVWTIFKVPRSLLRTGVPVESGFCIAI